MCKKNESIQFTGIDVSDLRHDMNTPSPKNIFTYLATPNPQKFRKSEGWRRKKKKNVNHMNSQVDQITDISPEQLRQQTQMMCSMTSNQIY